MSDHWIQLGTFIVTVLGLFGLLWYCLETLKLRKAADKQVKASHDLLQAAMDQVEGLSKPCLTLVSRRRNDMETISARLDNMGSTVAAGDQGHFVAWNIGNGPAINVSYQFIDLTNGPQRNMRYIQTLLHDQKITLVELLIHTKGDYRVVFHYESLGGRKYESTLVMMGGDHVLTNFRFVSDEARTLLF